MIILLNGEAKVVENAPAIEKREGFFIDSFISGLNDSIEEEKKVFSAFIERVNNIRCSGWYRIITTQHLVYGTNNHNDKWEVHYESL